MITIYGKPNCTYCEQAKLLLDSNNLSYTYKELDKDFTREDILKLNPNVRTFPQIFDGDRLIGGYQELVETMDGLW